MRGQALAPHGVRTRDPLWIVGGAFLGLLCLSTLLEADLRFSSHFYDPTAAAPWVFKHAIPWRWLYTYGEWPGWLLALAAVTVWLGSRWRRPWIGHRRACALLVLAVAFGPGLVVNGVVKSLWGRPRPAQSDVFGGPRPYRQWWQPGAMGGGRSLPSGHAAMGYILVVGVYLVPRSRPTWQRWLPLGGALAYGSLLGVTRIVQGGHFVSDVLWSGALMCFTAATLQILLQVTVPADAPGQAPVVETIIPS